jgi:hypothetical protein
LINEPLKGPNFDYLAVSVLPLRSSQPRDLSFQAESSSSAWKPLRTDHVSPTYPSALALIWF